MDANVVREAGAVRSVIRDVTRRARDLLLFEAGDAVAGGGRAEDGARDVAAIQLIRLATWKMLAARGVACGPIEGCFESGAFGELAGLPVFSVGDDGLSRSAFSSGPGVLGELIRLAGDPALERAWAPGGEETIGWIWQYFNEPDLEVFRSPRAPKVPADMVAVKTQLFTPRWIVECLVQNTLGRLWVEIHPDSELTRRLDYLVPLDGDRLAAPVKRAGEITVLDPACGTMHFGLVAFDWLVEMYREELRRAGQPGWPEQPSVERAADIPGAVLANNLFGIDIDLRAIELSALTLYLKAKGIDPRAEIAGSNLRCADVLLLSRKECGRREQGGGYARCIRGQAAANGRALECGYDVVVTNPPYLDSRGYNSRLKSFINSAYPATRRNLYSVFIECCLGLIDDSGRVGMVTPQTFMFISSFAKTRALVRRRAVIETLVHTGLNTFPDAVVDAAAYVLRCERGCEGGDLRSQRRASPVGTYFRLVREPDAQSKRVEFENALSCLRRGERCPAVYRCGPDDFDSMPGRLWAYWITPRVRGLFESLPRFKEVAQPVVGLQTSDNFRFLRYWWEVFDRGEGAMAGGIGENLTIGFGCKDRKAARATGRKWFPHMKGGSFRRWYGNQEYVVNWADDGAQIKTLGIETGKVASRPQNTDFYFRRGVTWTHTSSCGLSVRVLPEGFICNVEGMAAFQKGGVGSEYETLAILNSAFARHVIDLLNPTVHFGGREVGDLPYPTADRSRIEALEALVERAVDLAKADSVEDETTYDFVAPPAWDTGPAEVADRRARLAEIERQIDEEVYRLYDVAEADRAAIEADLSSPRAGAEARADGAGGGALSLPVLARGWISYAVGIVLGRFDPGVEGGLGCGRFGAEVAGALRGLLSEDGVGPLEPGHAEDLAAKVQEALEVMLGVDSAGEVIAVASAGGNGEWASQVRRYLERGFFKQHVQQYRRRPIYWLLQSPKRRCSVYVYYEGTRPGTISLLRDGYVGGKLSEIRRRVEDLRGQMNAASGREKTRLESELDDLRSLMADVEAFDRSLQRVAEMQNEHGERVGWRREIDDGVMLNLAPLHELVPSWRGEPGRYWERLQAGDYDWSYTARRYWPARVLAKCRTNQSHAHAHGRLDVYEPPM